MNSLVGKLFVYINTFVLFGMTEDQYKNHYISSLVRLEKIQARPIKSVSGFDIPFFQEGTTVLLLDFEKRYFAADEYTFYKVLLEDKILYIPMSPRRKWEEYFLKLS